jgi:hypothetical protein
MSQAYIEQLNEIFEGISDKVMERGWMSEFVNTTDFDLYIFVLETPEMIGYNDVKISFTDFSDEGSLSVENGYEIASWLYGKLVSDYRDMINFDTFGYIHVYFNDELIVKNIYDLEDFEE